MADANWKLMLIVPASSDRQIIVLERHSCCIARTKNCDSGRGCNDKHLAHYGGLYETRVSPG